jgi:ubiquinone/menaquinone biosynthesis C-methylase UbiE
MHVATKKPYRGLGMEGLLARWYNKTRGVDLADFRSQAQSIASRLAERHLERPAVLEVAPGPGFFSIELAKLGRFEITGLDISRSFVEIATENARAAGVQVGFRHGNASAMPFAAGSFDLIYCSAAFKNFAEPLAALDEMHRVLRGGGEAVIVDLRRDVSLADLDSYIHSSGRKRFDAWMTRWAFRGFLIRRAYTLDAFTRLVDQSQFGPGSCHLTLGPIGFEARLSKATS